MSCGVRNLNGLRKFPLSDQRIDLLGPYFIFILIQGTHLIIVFSLLFGETLTLEQFSELSNRLFTRRKTLG